MARSPGGRSDESGSVAAELAVALPVVVLTLLLSAGAMGAAAQQVLLQDVVSDAARLLGRGESLSAAQSVVTSAVNGAWLESRQNGDLICVTATVDAAVGNLLRIPLTASSCALSGGL